MREGAVSAKHPFLQLLPSLQARPSGEAPAPCHGRTGALSPMGKGAVGSGGGWGLVAVDSSERAVPRHGPGDTH